MSHTDQRTQCLHQPTLPTATRLPTLTQNPHPTPSLPISRDPRAVSIRSSIDDKRRSLGIAASNEVGPQTSQR